jgi:hypothetical protein
MGPLRAIGYVAEPGEAEQAYSVAVAKASAIPGTRINSRNYGSQIIEPFYLPYQPPHGTAAAVDFPLDYAMPIEVGFNHKIAKRFVPGTFFLYGAVEEERAQYYTDIRELMLGMQTIRPLTEAERQELREQKFLEGMRREAVRGEREMRQAFRETVSLREFDRQRGALKGVSRTGRKVYYMETKQERDERIENMYREWLQYTRSDSSGGF